MFPQTLQAKKNGTRICGWSSLNGMNKYCAKQSIIYIAENINQASYGTHGEVPNLVYKGRETQKLYRK